VPSAREGARARRATISSKVRDLGVGQQLVIGAEHFLRHAIGAADVAAIGHYEMRRSRRARPRARPRSGPSPRVGRRRDGQGAAHSILQLDRVPGAWIVCIVWRWPTDLPLTKLFLVILQRESVDSRWESIAGRSCVVPDVGGETRAIVRHRPGAAARASGFDGVLYRARGRGLLPERVERGASVSSSPAAERRGPRAMPTLSMVTLSYTIGPPAGWTRTSASSASRPGPDLAQWAAAWGRGKLQARAQNKRRKPASFEGQGGGCGRRATRDDVPFLSRWSRLKKASARAAQRRRRRAPPAPAPAPPVASVPDRPLPGGRCRRAKLRPFRRWNP